MQELMKAIHSSIESIISARVEERVAPIRALLGVDPDAHPGRGPKPKHKATDRLALAAHLAVPGRKSNRALSKALGISHSTVDRIAKGKKGGKTGRVMRKYTLDYKQRIAEEAKAKGVSVIANREGIPHAVVGRWARGEAMGPRGGSTPGRAAKAAAKKPKQKRRRFTREHKLTLATEAREQGVGVVAKREGVDRRAIESWMKGEKLGFPGGATA